MRRTAIMTLSVFLIAVAICTVSLLMMSNIVERARTLRSEAILAVEDDDPERAKELMVELAELWKDKSGLLEVLTSHDALHEVKTGIIEAQICLECGDHDDFLRTISTVGEGLEHIYDVEALSISNLY